MTSRGVGDVQRVLGQPQSWIELNFATPEPPLPTPLGDPLLEFLCSQVSGWERQVETEANEYHRQPLGAALVRYAQDIRAQLAAIRLVLARYGEARDAGAAEAPVLRAVLVDLATAYRHRHPDWRAEWSAG
ncbi:hypothetical protein [Kribbella solani]|uniref:Uncharacterized protein n=1 Tax=Kribbella solani TaxID=236067 RepID=A0A841DL89_9ACTN|nr:hypothetical protein [Kribbella solani]MBB5979874.1 hypothetical protein [Kribbella solani]